MLAEQAREVGGRAEHANALDAQVPLARVVVDDPDRRRAEDRFLLQLADDELARVAGADDHDLLAVRDEPPGAGRSTIVRASRREPATRPSRMSQSTTMTPTGTRKPGTGFQK